MDEKNLPPGYWLDNMPDPLHTKEDVEDLFRRVDELKAKQEAIEKASKN
jgi:hypothetical protein